MVNLHIFIAKNHKIHTRISFLLIVNYLCIHYLSYVIKSIQVNFRHILTKIRGIRDLSYFRSSGLIELNITRHILLVLTYNCALLLRNYNNPKYRKIYTYHKITNSLQFLANYQILETTSTYRYIISHLNILSHTATVYVQCLYFQNAFKQILDLWLNFEVIVLDPGKICMYGKCMCEHLFWHLYNTTLKIIVLTYARMYVCVCV